MSEIRTQVAIVGAGPIGLELAVALRRAGIDCVNFDRKGLAATISWFPQGMTFFSSTDRIAIAGVPLETIDQTKATKEQYLAYLRGVARTFSLNLRLYEEVVDIVPRDGSSGGFVLTTRNNHGEHTCIADKVALVTGDMDAPRKLGIEGEDLPHVSHYFHHPHDYFGRKLLVVGGKNSAAEAALRCYHAGVEVAMSYRGDEFHKKHIKYWLLPELLGRIHRGEIACHYSTSIERITPTHAVLRHGGGTAIEVEADFVLLLTGYVADMSLFRKLGVELHGESGTPSFNADTMETNVPGVYAAGTATAGTQEMGYQVFIENCHIHTQRIVAHLRGENPPPPPPPLTLPES